MTTINDIADLVQILQEHPEWRQVIRGLVIGEELAQVPQHLAALDQKLADFIEFVKQNAETVDRRLTALEQGQAVLEQRLSEFIEFVKQNAEAVDRRLEALEVRQDRTEAVMNSIRRDLAPLKGAHARNAALRATRRIARTQNCRQVRILDDDELYDLLQNNDTADIVPGERRSFVDADIIVQTENRDTGDTCYIAVEASFTAHEDDIRRAARNADYLTRFTGKAAIPVVAAVVIDPKVQPDFDLGQVHWYPIVQRDIEPD